MKNFIINSLETLINFINRVLVRLYNKKGITINNLTYDNKGRFLVYHLNNVGLDSHKSVLRNIYTTLMSNER